LNDLPIGLLFFMLGLLLLFSAFFSSSETSMLSLNRYRLKHLANEGHRGATQARRLLDTPDRLISAILIGNNLVNIAAASLATLIAIRLMPEHPDLALGVSTVTLTLVVLIFSEVTPKTLAQRYPEKIAFPASYVLRPLLVFLKPAIWLVNLIVKAIFWLMRVGHSHAGQEALSAEELKTIVNESGDSLPAQR